MASKREEFLKQLMETFRVEGEEHTQRLTEGLLTLERECDPARRAEETEIIYREAHSLKGAARAVGLRDVEIICQALESVLAGCKRGELTFSRPILDLLHAANDLVGRLIAHQGDAAPADLDQIDHLVKELENAAAGLAVQAPMEGSPGQVAVIQSPPPPDTATPGETEAQPALAGGWNSSARPWSNLQRKNPGPPPRKQRCVRRLWNRRWDQASLSRQSPRPRFRAAKPSASTRLSWMPSCARARNWSGFA